MDSNPTQGGFILSPPASSILSSTTSARSNLPHPRESPLRPGGSKESIFIRHVDQRLLHIQRRFAKRTTPDSHLFSNVDRDKADAWHDVKGYSSMRQACRDLDDLIDIVWISGTPGLQVPYLISMALLLTSVLSGMPPSPQSLFRTLRKLDFAFASLIQGRDVDTGEGLPGFTGRRGISDTEKVRVRSLVERTRVGVVEAFKHGEFEYEEPDSPEATDTDDANTDDDSGLVLDNADEAENFDDDTDSWDMEIAKVYDRTMVELGDTMEGPSIGLITEPRG